MEIDADRAAQNDGDTGKNGPSDAQALCAGSQTLWLCASSHSPLDSVARCPGHRTLLKIKNYLEQNTDYRVDQCMDQYSKSLQSGGSGSAPTRQLLSSLLVHRPCGDDHVAAHVALDAQLVVEIEELAPPSAHGGQRHLQRPPCE